MKRLARILGIVAVLALAAAGSGFAWLTLRYPLARPPAPEPIERTPGRVARGAYLVRHVCVCLDCHSDVHADRFSLPPRAGTEGRGGFPFDEKLGVPGVVCAQNITSDPETGKGTWSDGEIMRAIREGVSRDGRALFPMMPYPFYRSMGDEDVRAVVAYLRTLPPIRNAIPATRLAFPASLLIRFVPSPLAGPVPAPDPARDPLGHGRYLATIGGCIDCHSPRDEHGAPILAQALSGGWEMVGPWGRVVTANLTPDPDNWMGRATREEFIGRFRAFAGMDGETAPLAPPGQNTVMPWVAFAGMTDADLGAIYDYLRSVPPVKKKVVTFPDAPGASAPTAPAPPAG